MNTLLKTLVTIILTVLIIGAIVGVKTTFFTPTKLLQYDNLRLQLRLTIYAPLKLQECIKHKELFYVITNDSLYIRELLIHQRARPDNTNQRFVYVGPLTIFPPDTSKYLQEAQDGIYEVRETKKAFSEKEKVTLDSLILTISKLYPKELTSFSYIDDYVLKDIDQRISYSWENDTSITTESAMIIKDTQEENMNRFDLRGNNKVTKRTLPYLSPREKEIERYERQITGTINSDLLEKDSLRRLYYEEDILPHKDQIMSILMSYRQHLGKPRRDTLSFEEARVIQNGDKLENIFKEVTP